MFATTIPSQTAVYAAKNRQVTLTVPTRLGGSQARQLVAQAQRAVQQEPRFLVLDVGKTVDIGTHGLVALKAINNMLRQSQRAHSSVRLLNARQSLLRVLHGYGFNDYTLIYGDC